ncbi:MAG TPA: hypothetical protein VEU76_09225, partial [Candidatus Udaeobacter sp.]|nr:hypothetical protein [Candidatus Udaeobacter sp.]
MGRIRLFAGASALALAGALSMAVVPAAADQSPGRGVKFTSQSAQVQLTAHFSRNPTHEAAAASTSSANEDLRVPVLSPKGPRANGEAREQEASGAPASGSSNSSEDGSGSTPAASASFIGMQSSATICNYFGPGCNPPDMAIAASSQWVFQGVNTSFEVLDPAGHVQAGWPVNAQQFFGVPNDTNADGTPCDTAHGSRAFLSDPRAFYDPVDKRFWAAELQAAGVPILGIAPGCPLLSKIWVAVSQTSDPRGRWNVYAFNTQLDPGFFNDYTQFGFDRQAIYVSANMFRIDNTTGATTGFYAELFEANKSQMERGKAHFTPDAFFNLQATGPGAPASSPFLADTVQPAVNLDSSGGGAETFIDTLDGPDPVTGNNCGFTGLGFSDSCSGLALWRLSNPIAHDTGGAAPTLKGSYVATPPYHVTPPSDQPSCNACVDSND